MLSNQLHVGKCKYCVIAVEESAQKMRRSFPDPSAPYFAIALTFKWCLSLCLLSLFGFDPIYITPPLTHHCVMPPLLLTLILSQFLNARLHMLALLIM